MQCNAMQCNAMQCNAMQCNAMQCNAKYFIPPNKNKATWSPEISREQVQRLTPQFLLYIYIGYRFPLSISTIWGNHVPVNFMLKFPTCISTIWRNHLPHLTSK